MKKRIIITLLVLTALSAQLYAQTTFYVYRNDGQMHGFFNNEVDSIVYSNLDIDSVEHSVFVVQEVWTTDSVYRIPLAAIDSVGFVTPETTYKPGVIKLEGTLRNYLNDAKDDRLLFAKNTPSDLLPRVGDKLVSLEMSNIFPVGFAGEVSEVNTSDDVIEVVCGSVELEDVFETLYVFSEGSLAQYTRSERPNTGHQMPRSDTTGWSRTFTTDWTRFLEMNLILSETESYAVTPTLLTFSYTPDIWYNGMAIVNNQYGYYFSVTVTGNHQIQETIGGSGRLSWTKNARIDIPTFRLPICPFLEFFFEPGLFVKAEAEINSNITFTQNYKSALHYEWSSRGMTSGKNTFYLSPLSNSISGDLMLNGNVAFGAYFEFGVQAFRSVLGRLQQNWGSLRATAEMGWKAESNGILTKMDTERAQQSTLVYEQLRDNRVVFSKYLSTGITFQPIPWLELSAPLPISWEEAIGAKRHVPVFSNTKLEKKGDGTLTASVQASGSCFTPVIVGFVLQDADGEEKDRFYFSSTFPNRSIAYEHDFKNLDLKSQYTLYPVVEYRGYEMLAMPSRTYNIPVRLKNVRQDSEAFENGKVKAKMKGQIEIVEGSGYDMSTFKDYGTYSKNLVTGEESRYSVVERGNLNFTYNTSIPREDFNINYSDYTAWTDVLEMGTYTIDQDDNIEYYSPITPTVVYDHKPSITIKDVLATSIYPIEDEKYDTECKYTYSYEVSGALFIDKLYHSSFNTSWTNQFSHEITNKDGVSQYDSAIQFKKGTNYSSTYFSIYGDVGGTTLLPNNYVKYIGDGKFIITDSMGKFTGARANYINSVAIAESAADYKAFPLKVKNSGNNFKQNDYE
ncbi:MAG: hypothetical protein IJM78_06950 [Prevotella sp.]|nr:hypothetical protein [Prevotella sp.]